MYSYPPAALSTLRKSIAIMSIGDVEVTVPGVQPEIFQSRGGFMKLGHFDKHFVKNPRKKGPAGGNFGVFSPRYS